MIAKARLKLIKSVAERNDKTRNEELRKTMQAKAQLEQQISAKLHAPSHSSDSDPQETVEWLEAWDQILNEESPERASYLRTALAERDRSAGLALPPTPYHQHESTY